MRSIKYFEYKNTREFEKFLREYRYFLNDAKGFKFLGKKQYHGNILKVYIICLKDGEEVYFSVVDFKSWNECNQSRLGFNGPKLEEWYNDAIVIRYKVKDVWGLKDEYVIKCVK